MMTTLTNTFHPVQIIHKNNKLDLILFFLMSMVMPLLMVFEESQIPKSIDACSLGDDHFEVYILNFWAPLEVSLGCPFALLRWSHCSAMYDGVSLYNQGCCHKHI